MNFEKKLMFSLGLMDVYALNIGYSDLCMYIKNFII